MSNSTQIFRFGYVLIIGFLLGIFVAQYLPNARTEKIIASKNNDIQAKQQIIDGLVNELE